MKTNYDFFVESLLGAMFYDNARLSEVGEYDNPHEYDNSTPVEF